MGGLLAGVVINVVEFITNGVILREAWGQAMKALGKPQLSAGAVVIFNIWGFLLGIAAVWLYAAIRPRYGAGPKTAIRAGFVAWAIAVFLANLGNYPLGLFPTRLLVISSMVALVETVIIGPPTTIPFTRTGNPVACDPIQQGCHKRARMKAPAQPRRKDGRPAFIIRPRREFGNIVRRRISLEAADLPKVVHCMRSIRRAPTHAENEQPPAALTRVHHQVHATFDRRMVKAVDCPLELAEVFGSELGQPSEASQSVESVTSD